MTVVDHRSEGVDLIVLNTDWEGYDKILDAAEGRHLRITYDLGEIEIMTRSLKHERLKTLLRKLAEAWMEERDIDYSGGGEVTLRRQDLNRGLEPDECFWVAHHDLIGDEYDPERDPPPDLVIEVEVSRSILDRRDILQALGVGELWLVDEKGTVRFESLGPEGYRPLESGGMFPQLTPAVLERFLRLGREKRSTTAMVRAFRAWIRDLDQ